MTGYGSAFYRYDCEKRGCQNLALPNWDDLLSAFPRGIRPTDVDGLVEIRGNFLFMEQKGLGVPLGNGQRRALAALGEQPRTTVVVVREHDTQSDELEVLKFPNPQGFRTVNRSTFRAWLAAWAEAADRKES